MSTDPERIGQEILHRLETAWNAADGLAFARPFASDADFVDIRGEHHRGRDAIAAGHQGIFRSIYAESRIRYSLYQARLLADDVLLVHSRGEISVPSGPMAGEHRATQSLVLVRGGEEWLVASFHNTQVPAAAHQRSA